MGTLEVYEWLVLRGSGLSIASTSFSCFYLEVMDAGFLGVGKLFQLWASKPVYNFPMVLWEKNLHDFQYFLMNSKRFQYHSSETTNPWGLCSLQLSGMWCFGCTCPGSQTEKDMTKRASGNQRHRSAKHHHEFKKRPTRSFQSPI